MSGAFVLTDDELALLDGRCSEKVQPKVDAALRRIAMSDARPDLDGRAAGLIADVVNEARTNGLVLYQSSRLVRCPICERSAGYVKFKSGPRRGKDDLKRPLSFPGREFAYRFVTVRGSACVGGCDECVLPLLPDIVEALRGVQAQMPAALRAEGEPVWKKEQNRRCTKCGWEGHEGQMGRRRTMMGDGTFPATCPSCGAGEALFSRDIEHADGFTVVSAEPVSAS